jgi:hypothetical protein
MLFALGFITMFTLGGISGIMLAVVPFDIHVSDTYFIVAHIHYVLFGGSVFTIFAGLYHWFPKMTGRMYDETLGRLHFWMSFIFFNLTFGPDAPRGHRRHAEARGRLRRAVRDLERDHLDLGVHLRRVVPDLPLQHDRLCGGRACRVGNRGARTRSSGGVLAAAGVQLREVPTVVGGPYEVRLAGASSMRSRTRRPQGQAPYRSRRRGRGTTPVDG